MFTYIYLRPRVPIYIAYREPLGLPTLTSFPALTLTYRLSYTETQIHSGHILYA